MVLKERHSINVYFKAVKNSQGKIHHRLKSMHKEIYEVMSMLYKIILLSFMLSVVVEAKTNIEEKWEGRWQKVDSPGKILPDEELFKSANIYDVFLISNVTKIGFDYKNVGNDVGYGPNEMTYAQGSAVFISDNNALDSVNNLKIAFYQGKVKQDRGIQVVNKNQTINKYFKQIPTVFDAGFNCKKASTHIEVMICHVAIIAKADKELGALYKKLRKTINKKEAADLRRTQRVWVKKRNTKCQNRTRADEVCLSSLYASRLLNLQGMLRTQLVNDKQSLDNKYMKDVYGRSQRLWDDTVLRLIFKSHKQDEFVKKWMTYQPDTKAVFTSDEAVFTGQIQYETIIWPANVIVTIDYQLIVDKESNIWFSTRSDYGRGIDVETHFGPKEVSKSVLKWIKSMQISKK